MRFTRRSGGSAWNVGSLIPIPDPISTPGAGCGKGPDEPCGKDEEGHNILSCAESDEYGPCPTACTDDDGNVTSRFCNSGQSPCPDALAKCAVCRAKDGSPICQNCDTDEDDQVDTCTTVTGVSGLGLVPVGISQTDTASGSGLKCVSWSGGDDPGEGSGPRSKLLCPVPAQRAFRETSATRRVAERG